MRWQRASASSMLWVVSRTVLPSWLYSRMISQSRMRVWGSRPALGSSRNRTCGTCIMARAMERRCIIPPEKPRTICWARSVSLNFSSRESASSERSLLGIPKYAAWKVRISRAVREKSRLGRCGTTPIRRLTVACSDQTSWSPTNALPLVARTRVVSTPTVVDFPAPFGPKRPKISPGFTSRDRPFRALICALGCLDLPLGRDMNPAPAAGGGGELYTLCRSSVRTPTAILFIPYMTFTTGGTEDTSGLWFCLGFGSITQRVGKSYGTYSSHRDSPRTRRPGLHRYLVDVFAFGHEALFGGREAVAWSRPEDVQGGPEDYADDQFYDEASHDYDGKGALRVGADVVRHGGGQQAQGRDQHGHHDRAETERGSFFCCFPHRHAASTQLVDVLDHNYADFDGDSDQR